MKLKSLVRLTGEHARQVMIDLQLELMPTWVYVTDEGANVMATPWRDDLEKQIMATQVRKAMLKDHATAYSFITEAWMAKAPKGWDPATDEPFRASEQPNRQECVVAFATDGEHIEWKRWAIRRDILEMVTDLEEQPFNYSKMQSWMTQMLK